MKNIQNQKGFILVETLVVAVFVVGVFALLYNNFYPLMGEYEKREVYDDVDGKYSVYWIKRVIQHPDYVMTDARVNDINTKGYIKFSCEDVKSNSNLYNTCKSLVKKAEVRNCDSISPNIYITKYKLTEFKEFIDNDSSFSGGMHNYVNYLPEFTHPSLNYARYRVIVEFHHKRDENNFLSYASIEVKK